jgi:hypothetical protein
VDKNPVVRLTGPAAGCVLPAHAPRRVGAIAGDRAASTDIENKNEWSVWHSA